MRFPIRAQILLPTSLVMLVVGLGSFTVNVLLAQRSAKDRIQRRIVDVTRIFEQSAFPLTDSVLSQMSGLAGADFVLLNLEGEVVGQSANRFLAVAAGVSSDDESSLGLVPITVDGRRYFHRVLAVKNAWQGRDFQLHAYFPADEFRRIWQRALLPSLVIAGSALVAALGCVYWISGSVGSATRGIVRQLRGVSTGNFEQAGLPTRNDELRDIAVEINKTAEMLKRYESEVRDGERMKTMVAMGAGLAHQLRNSATGCRMALDIFAEGNQVVEDEALLVAHRQLSLMENYLQRFLVLAKVEPNRVEQSSGNLVNLVERAITLVRHSAKHLKVELQWNPSLNGSAITGDLIAIEQAIVNLLLNAIEAASTAMVSSDELSLGALVHVELRYPSAEEVAIVVRDNGPGPKHDRDVFAPFVSEKQDGIGLGLVVVKEVAEEHGGAATWQRSGDWTEFALTLPSDKENT